MRLPNAERAIVDLIKLRDYCLNPRHPRGRYKARVFAATLGFTGDDAETLRAAILAALPTVEARGGIEDEFGSRFTVDCPVTGRRGSAVVRTARIIRRNEDAPRLTTCFIMTGGG
jgi:hypothetical protein